MVGGILRACGAPGLVGHAALLVLCLGSLGGCASTRASQKRVTAADIDSFKPVCPSETQLTGSHPNETDGTYRDRIIMVCVKVINARYGEFVDALSTESTGVNLVTDVAAQGFSAAASIITKADLARKFAAGSALSLGIGATVNKDLFYKQTMPAITASMDARRNKVLTEIVRSQNSDPTGKVYTLVRAGYDLDRYQEAGSLVMAVRELNEAAGKNATKAEADLQVEQRDLGLFQTSTSDEMMDRAVAASGIVRALTAQGNDGALRQIARALSGKNPAADRPVRLIGADIRIEIAKVASMPVDQQDARMKQIEAALAPYQGAVQ